MLYANVMLIFNKTCIETYVSEKKYIFFFRIGCKNPIYVYDLIKLISTSLKNYVLDIFRFRLWIYKILIK